MAPAPAYYVGRSEDTKWAWWFGGSVIHEVGVGTVVFIVLVCSAPRFWGCVICGGEEGPKHGTKASIGNRDGW